MGRRAGADTGRHQFHSIGGAAIVPGGGGGVSGLTVELYDKVDKGL